MAWMPSPVSRPAFVQPVGKDCGTQSDDVWAMVCPCPVVAGIWGAGGTGVGFMVAFCSFPAGFCGKLPADGTVCDEPFSWVCNGGVVCARAFIASRPTIATTLTRIAIIISENRGVRRAFVGATAGSRGTADT